MGDGKGLGLEGMVGGRAKEEETLEVLLTVVGMVEQDDPLLTPPERSRNLASESETEAGVGTEGRGRTGWRGVCCCCWGGSGRWCGADLMGEGVRGSMTLPPKDEG